jgi:hypothetical protein
MHLQELIFAHEPEQKAMDKSASPDIQGPISLGLDTVVFESHPLALYLGLCGTYETTVALRHLLITGDIRSTSQNSRLASDKTANSRYILAKSFRVHNNQHECRPYNQPKNYIKKTVHFRLLPSSKPKRSNIPSVAPTVGQ